MYLIVRSKNFTKTLKKMVRGGLSKSAQNKIIDTIDLLALGESLPQKYRDHQLKGDLLKYRECHVQGDLLIMYQIIDDDLLLLLVDVGTHNDLFD